MAGYVKIWTTILTSSEFKSLKLNEKGAYLLLIIFTKENRDNGHVVVNSMEEIAIKMGTNRKTAVKIVEKLRTLGMLTVSKNSLQQIDIFLPNYIKWQQLTTKEVARNMRLSVGKNSELLPTKSVLPDQTIPNQSRPIPPEKNIVIVTETPVDDNISEDTREVSSYFIKRYEKIFGVPYVFNAGKDHSIIMELLKTFDKEKLKRLIDDFFVLEDDFLKKAGYTVRTLKTNINKLAQGGGKGDTFDIESYRKRVESDHRKLHHLDDNPYDWGLEDD